MLCLILAGGALVEVKKLEFAAARKQKEQSSNAQVGSEVVSSGDSASKGRKKKTIKEH